MTKETIYCDRCGSVCGYVHIKEYRLYRKKFIIAKENYGVEADLCQKCQDSLYEWMKAGKKAQDTAD